MEHLDQRAVRGLSEAGPGLRVRLVLGLGQHLGGARPTYGGFFWNIALGAMYKLTNGIALRGELGYAGLKLGAAWLF